MQNGLHKIMNFPRDLSLLLVALLVVRASRAQVMPTTFEGIDASSCSYAGLNVDPNGAEGGPFKPYCGLSGER